jgi:DNA invertase Pin-like site-specific DNA recombinase
MKTPERPPASAAGVEANVAPRSLLRAAPITPAHLERLALVYVRQSSPKQLLENRESTARQYAFAEQAVALGWPRPRVVIIDEDLGKSGRTAEGRSGFQRLVTEVTLNHAGLVLGLEMSRLARSSKDWHAFFEMCALFGTLIGDEDGLYDGNDPNDRLILGLKSSIS